jgi:hypothetical protein
VDTADNDDEYDVQSEDEVVSSLSFLCLYYVKVFFRYFVLRKM